MKKVALHNLGCKVNAYETDAMQEMLEQHGYEIVPFQEKADIYIINTCTVTNMADRKSRQMIHRAKKMNPEALVVAAGCYVQAQEESGQIDECIDVLIGNNRKKDLIRILEEHIQKAVIDINHTKEYEEMHIQKTAEHTRAYIKVQDGCNQFCTYCIIPYARGRVRSRAKEDVIQEVRDLARNGYQEVVLTGIHLSSYGVDLENESLLSLILAVHEVEGIQRIRLGSLEPRIITEEFAKTISALPKMCPHFHLSLQSGCDETLRRMNRRYTSAEYLEKCELLRKYFNNPALTTDVIVGFPGETEEDFLETMSLVEECKYDNAFTFIFSVRRGTPAEKIKDNTSLSEKEERLQRLNEVVNKYFLENNQKLVGTVLNVLVEGVSEKKDMYYGYSDTNKLINFTSSKELMPGDLVDVEITSAKTWSLDGKVK